MRLKARRGKGDLVRVGFKTRARAHNKGFKGKIMTTDNIKMYTTTWCSDCRRAKAFLKQHNVEVEEINIEEVEGTAEHVMKLNDGKRKVPTFEVGAKVFNLSPYDERKLRTELGIN